MEFYMPKIPLFIQTKQLKSEVFNSFKKYRILAFDLSVWTDHKANSKSARITIHDADIGRLILAEYGYAGDFPPRRGRQYRPPKGLRIAGAVITLQLSRNPYPDRHTVATLKRDNERKLLKLNDRQPDQHKMERKPIAFNGFECGVWSTYPQNPTRPTFQSFYHNPHAGRFRITKEAVQVDIGPGSKYILLNSFGIQNMDVTREDGFAYYYVSMYYAPKFYEKELGTVTLPSGKQKQEYQKMRVPSLDDQHAHIAPYCFVYRFCIEDLRDFSRILTIHKLPGFVECGEPRVHYVSTTYDFKRSMTSLSRQLQTLPFGVAFQLQALAFNGILLPHQVKGLLTVVRQACRTHGDDKTSAVLKLWADVYRPQRPTDDPEQWLPDAILEDFKQALDKHQENVQVMIRAKLYRKENQVMVHRVSLSPSGLYLYGPTLEPKNRVLRQYSRSLNSFLRVMVIDEDGGELQFEPGTSFKKLYSDRFIPFFMPGSQNINIGGSVFEFLGFSQSSLRAHAAWFVAPFGRDNTTYRAVDIIRELGDFGKIRLPGKCAARIGQAFTDTQANIKIEFDKLKMRPDVKKAVLVWNAETRAMEQREFCFSDGCGTFSWEILQKIWDKGKFELARVQPTIFQIRIGGAKGVVSLDTRLQGEVLRLRHSMVKFDARPEHNDFEICKSVTKPLPFFLNRHLIQVLECLGVPKANFKILQDNLLRVLNSLTGTADQAAYFLETQLRCKHADTPFLIRELEDRLRISYREDEFLRQVVECSMLSTLRELKYRARIPIAMEFGFTLIGVMDETGFLNEGEIYCPIKLEGENRQVHTGRVAIARSPTLHPGDVQIVTAVKVLPNNPLWSLTNCVVFSSKGDRDLPNKLSGGDLDGDLYHIWWDPLIMPRTVAEPADFHVEPAQPLDHPVTQVDIGKFFLDFMENDRLGAISTRHTIYADRQDDGVFSQECLKCARMASIAVDFPKSGVPVQMSDLPKNPPERPDFLAPSPRVKLTNEVNFIEEEQYDSDDDMNNGLDEVDSLIKMFNSTALAKQKDADDPFAPTRKIRYYESQKALGILYREIDEYKFIKKWKDSVKRAYQERGQRDVLKIVSEYLLTKIPNLDVMYALWSDFAADLRVSYEYNVQELAVDYAPRRDHPLREVEVFIGCIIGNESRKVSKYQREQGEGLKGEINRLIMHIVKKIRHGEDDDVVEEGRYDGFTLERATICVMEAMTARQDDEGHGRSFGWIAASVALRELARQSKHNQLERQAVTRGLGGLNIV